MLNGVSLKNEKIIKCPKCKVHMEKISNGRYVIDRCVKCGGIFLDKDEIENINRVSLFSYIIQYFKR